MKKKRKYTKSAAWFKRYPYLAPKKDKLVVFKYTPGQRVWHVDNRPGDACGYKVLGAKATPYGVEYELHRWDGGYTRMCMEKEICAHDFTPQDWARLNNAKSIVTNRDLQIGILKDKLHFVQKELDELKAKTQGNLGVLVPQLQKERDQAMEFVNSTRDTVQKYGEKVKRLQGIVNAYIDGRI
jgi:hypothetical protein